MQIRCQKSAGTRMHKCLVGITLLVNENLNTFLIKINDFDKRETSSDLFYHMK